METSLLVVIFSALVGAISSQTVGFLTHYSAEQRERLARQYSFREKQLQEFYAPLLALTVELNTQWQLHQYLRSQEPLVSPTNTAELSPVQRYNEDVHRHQNETLEAMVKISKEKFHLAEPTTKEKIVKLFRSNENRKAVRYNIPIDSTGDPIPTIDQPYPPDLVGFMLEVEEQYNNIATELRTAQFNDLQASYKILETAFPTILIPPQKD